MAFEKIRPYQYIADTKEDLKNIKEKKIGVECFVIKEACEYKLMSTGEWIKQVSKGSTVSSDGNGNIDLSDYATEEYVDNAIANIKFPETDLSEYVKRTELNEFVKTSDLIEYAKLTDIPSTDDFVTQEIVNQKIDQKIETFSETVLSSLVLEGGEVI